jgi:hypothetical protein
MSPWRAIRKQLNISERSMRRILAFAKKNPDSPVQERMQGSGRLKDVIDREGAITKY